MGGLNVSIIPLKFDFPIEFIACLFRYGSLVSSFT